MNKDDRNFELVDTILFEVDERIRNRKSKNSSIENNNAKKNNAIKNTNNDLYSSMDNYIDSSVKKSVNSTHSSINSMIDSGVEEMCTEASRCFIHVSEDGHEAYLMLYKRDDREYTYEDILEYLESQNITYGVIKEAICNMIDDKIYYEEVLVAEGITPNSGSDAYFEFHFNTNPEIKPIIYQDGSVDYNTLGKIELVDKGQLLATYHEPVPAVEGKDVYGKPILVKKANDIKPLRGKGFEMTEDQKQYYSTIEGRVSYNDNQLSVIPIFTVEGDVEAATGDINFNGDVLVKGNVFANVTITATANITVNGHVEVANLVAGKDVLLKNGMQGSGVGTINAKGNVMAKFLEQTRVRAKGNICANTILNCVTQSDKSIIVSGTRGAILGGSARAVEKITAFTLGNKIGIHTKLIIGLEEDFKKAMSLVDEKIEECKDSMFDIEKTLKNLTLKFSKSPNPIVQENRNKSLRDKIQCQTKLNELIAKREELIDIKERSACGSIQILGQVNPGITIIINGIIEELKSECKNVTIFSRMNEIRFFSNKID